MPSHPAFGSIVSGNQVEDAVENTVKYWVHDYLREVEYQNSLPFLSLEDPKQYTNRTRFDGVAGEPLPRIVTISDGLIEPPKLRSGTYEGTWRVGIGIAINAKNEETANDYVKMYAAAIRLLLMHNGSLTPKGFAQETLWVDEKYPPTIFAGQILQYKTAALFFNVTVQNVADRWAGPDVLEQIDYHQADTVDVILTKVDIEDEV